MPTKKEYPAGWKYFSAWIRFVRADGRCECIGECGLHTSQYGGRRCREIHGKKALYARGDVVLTTMHLCDCAPPCLNEKHVKAACQRCHLRVDVPLHVKNSRETRAKKRLERQPCLI